MMGISEEVKKDSSSIKAPPSGLSAFSQIAQGDGMQIRDLGADEEKDREMIRKLMIAP